ncbi:MAG: hypothetical protein A2534_05130 [Candidatus Magasanikbacteria bacterium RIFOXYD2_FULL_39_9]|uniref:Uncharacterized protein n=1 Tax=Candidatus Magasanikbacteria bacterium RIFOXYD1_FULL_40_23 TaxID=1798705 RepID=A0A1F6P7P6_9BACT|nr:MAG: hypothetical protein A2534_05130 [Candidatus Magasanikbacteria bacterium RIFOXYD2_FULL_39_9]OGH92138.1 MAG: hypothetical protein A2563_00955 [Candidatus Magasanikbacteria bacterium RIFOXYD1_FULL_40_23]
MSGKKLEEKMDNLEAIKRLLVLLLIKQGVGIDAVADVLEVGVATVSRMVPQKKLKKGNKITID